MKNVLVIGKGGREHALAYKLSQSQHVAKVFVIPGNQAIDNDKIQSVNINSLDFEAVCKFAIDHQVALTVVGPEVELAAGIVDAFEKHNLRVFGPNKYCAQIESSKDFAKQKMMKFNIPTANYQTFDDDVDALNYLADKQFPIVLKVDGLAAGKGVTIPQTLEESWAVINDIFHHHKYGSLDPKVVIEEFLQGEEFSLLAFVHDRNIAYMQIAQDHKRALDGDQGDNTGGMGVYTPVKHISQDEIKQGQDIITKMVNGLADEGTPFTGVLYAGLMTTAEGVKTIEFNARFGDPEAEVILLAMQNDLYEVINKIMNNEEVKLEWSPQSFVGVVLASQGYPQDYESGKPLNLSGLDAEDIVFHMGTKIENNDLVSNGGRVLLAVGHHQSFVQAKQNAYEIIDKIKTNDFVFRKDIGRHSKE